ncbi:hypothetical protein [Pelosinus sp. UFO1]|uniref:hypothetical protein n=1 Tax=Pelosinus sp. UFO1 TaxID=484770 RepID=UPI000AB5DE71|nr:hypothetical protein [Pelosinus sp. UFO1]
MFGNILLEGIWGQVICPSIKPGEAYGIDYFAIYFFPTDETDSAKVFIDELRQG